jgi:hypothetical protein
MKVSNIAVGLFFAALGAFLWILSARLPIPRHITYGPGFFPTIIGIGLIAVGLTFVWQGIQELKTRAWFDLPGWSTTNRGRMRFFGLVGGILFYALVSRTFGFTITAATILTILLVISRIPPVRAILVSCFVSVIFTILFASILKVPLPWGPFRDISGYLLW